MIEELLADVLLESYTKCLVDDEFGDVEDVAHILGSAKFILECPDPFSIPRVAKGDGEESGDEVNEDT
jgi:hypothetical protein